MNQTDCQYISCMTYTICIRAQNNTYVYIGIRLTVNVCESMRFAYALFTHIWTIYLHTPYTWCTYIHTSIHICINIHAYIHTYKITMKSRNQRASPFVGTRISELRRPRLHIRAFAWLCWGGRCVLWLQAAVYVYVCVYTYAYVTDRRICRAMLGW